MLERKVRAVPNQIVIHIIPPTLSEVQLNDQSA